MCSYYKNKNAYYIIFTIAIVVNQIKKAIRAYTAHDNFYSSQNVVTGPTNKRIQLKQFYKYTLFACKFHVLGTLIVSCTKNKNKCFNLKKILKSARFLPIEVKKHFKMF